MKTLLLYFLANKDKKKKNALLANIRWARLQEPFNNTLVKTFDDNRFNASFKVNNLLFLTVKRLAGCCFRGFWSLFLGVC